jgi:hypothetical protein
MNQCQPAAKDFFFLSRARILIASKLYSSPIITSNKAEFEATVIQRGDISDEG